MELWDIRKTGEFLVKMQRFFKAWGSTGKKVENDGLRLDLKFNEEATDHYAGYVDYRAMLAVFSKRYSNPHPDDVMRRFLKDQFLKDLAIEVSQFGTKGLIDSLDEIELSESDIDLCRLRFKEWFDMEWEQ